MKIGLFEILVVAFIILLLFGGKKLPEFTKGITDSIREFRKGFTEKDKED